METASNPGIRARVTVYRLARLRLAQVFLPIGVISTTIARRAPAPTIVGVAAVAFAATMISFARAISSRAGQLIAVSGGALYLGDRNPKIRRADLRRWILIGSVAWLYCYDTTYRVRTTSADGPTLEKYLTGLFGAPEPIKYRGSWRARMTALCASLVGLALVVSAFTLHESMVSIFIGVPLFILGLATFATLSSRVVQAP
jgi:hypothetical protein